MPYAPQRESQELEHPDRSHGRLIPHPDRDVRDTSLRRRAERPRARGDLQQARCPGQTRHGVLCSII
jgi:hypothetical protein